jgi:hypothetical protein
MTDPFLPPPLASVIGGIFLASGKRGRLNLVLYRVQCNVSLLTPVELKHQAV